MNCDHEGDRPVEIETVDFGAGLTADRVHCPRCDYRSIWAENSPPVIATRTSTWAEWDASNSELSEVVATFPALLSDEQP